MKRTAYSYRRWSKAEQGAGDSKRRQSIAAEICREKGWILDVTMKLEDAGVRAFDGRNSRLGALRSFLDAVKDERVKPGSVLIIEEIDRLSRQMVLDALNLFTGILDAGISIYVSRTDREFSREAIADNPHLLNEAVYALILGHDESAKKSFRSRKWWEGRRAKAAAKLRPMTGACPSWLTLDEDSGKFVIIKDAVAAVKRIVALVLDGCGLTVITRLLTEEDIPPIGRKGRWLKSTIQDMVHSRSLIGEFQPHCWKEGKRIPVGPAIPGFYPAIIEVDEFERMQTVLKARRRQTGPIADRATNLFTGLLYLPTDDCSLILHRQMFKGKTYWYLCSSGALEHGKGRRQSIPYDLFENVVLRFLREMTAADLTGENVAGEVEALEAAVAAKDERLAALQEALAGDGDLALIQVVRTVEAQKAKLDEQLQRAKEKAAAQRPAILYDTQSLIDLLASSKGEAIRLKMRSRLKEFLARIDVWITEENRYNKTVHIKLHFHSGKSRCIYFIVQRGKMTEKGLWSNGIKLYDFGKRVVLELMSTSARNFATGSAPSEQT